MSDFEAGANVREFFVEQLSAAMQDLKVETAEETRVYLVELLSGFAESERIPALSTPLFEHLQAAVAVNGMDRQLRLQVLGDIALFLAGFFPDSFDRRGVSESYVVSLGGRAYLMVARQSARRRERLFAELGQRFRELVRVLDEVRERTSLCSDGELLKLYDRFQQNASPQLERRLKRRGVILPETEGLPN